MQILKTLAFCFLFAPFYFGQISFYNTYSDQGYDVGEGIVQLIDSSYLVTGSSSSFEGNSQAFIMKIDSLGNRLWSKDFGGFESDRGRRIFYVENDGIYVAGQTNSFGNFYDAYFFKTDLSGNLLYEKHYGSAAYENIHDGVLLPDTSFILVGETYNTSNESENIYVLRVNRFGDTLWTKNFGSEQKDVARSIKLLNDSTVIIAGEYYVTDSLTQKAMLIKMDIDGNVEWLKTYGDQGKYVLNDISVENNVIRGVGYNYNENYIQGFSRNLIFKCDEDGLNQLIVSEVHNGNFAFQCISHFGMNSNDYYLSTKAYESPDIPTYPDGSLDIVINKFTSDMYYNNASFKPSNLGDDIPNEMIATYDNGAILVGSNQTPNIGGSNILLVKIGANDYFPFANAIPQNQTLVSLKEIKNNSIINIYPNPTNSYLRTDSKSFNGKHYRILNQLNQIVLEGKVENETILMNNLGAGIYFFEIENKLVKIIKE